MPGLYEEAAHATDGPPEERVGLRLSHITLRSELNEAEQQNIIPADAWAFSRKHNPMRESFGRSLHRRMFCDVWLWAGKYRTTNKNLGVDYALIHSRLYEVLDNINHWVEHSTFPPDEVSARFHHGLVAIHPFPNGNGRWSRIMADVLAVRLDQSRLTWGRTNLQDVGGTRDRYIAALKAADDHDFGPLIAFARS
jgi:Fic-DOC domain mobile mystery protein B